METKGTTPDVNAFFYWLENTISHKELVELAAKAREEYTALETFGDASVLEATLEAFILYLQPVASCDHEAGICNCDLRTALKGEPK